MIIGKIGNYSLCSDLHPKLTRQFEETLENNLWGGLFFPPLMRFNHFHILIKEELDE